ncbi:hypothetical protein Leryth_008853 [Lithospermum erythrorhizon]|nr:hypothetical protein Leryth_008853 [Lithospermum erythrorhizon]
MYSISGLRLPTIPSVDKIGGRWSYLHTHRKIKNNSISRKIFARKPLNDSESRAFATSEKVLVPGVQSNGSSSSTEQLEIAKTVSEEFQVSPDTDISIMEPVIGIGVEDLIEPTSSNKKSDREQKSVSSLPLDEDACGKEAETSFKADKSIAIESDIVMKRIIPPPGNGQKIYEIDPMLSSYRSHLDYRYQEYKRIREAIDQNEGGLEMFSRGYEKLGFTRRCS